MKKFYNIIIKYLGLNVDSIGSDNIERSIDSVLSRHGIALNGAAVPDFDVSSGLITELIDEITVPETWFFRDSESFKYLRDYSTKKFLNNTQEIKILSVPCSTGEEPYSIAMTLLAAGFEPFRIIIDAIDINKICIEKAEAGVFGNNSFRNGIEPDLLFFDVIDNAYVIKDTVKRCIRFECCNALEPSTFKNDIKYDIIFCKNLIIYLTEDARKQLLANLENHLAPDGLIFAGHTEALAIQKFGFEPVKPLRAFACKRTLNTVTDSHSALKPLSTLAQPEIKPKIEAKHSTKRLYAKQHKNEVKPNPNSTVELNVSIEDIKRLADSSDFKSAEKLCRSYLRSNSANAEVFSLLGLVQSAMGNTEAGEESFNKALYLDPDNYDALMNLGLLFENRGDKSKARLFFLRAKTAAEKEK